jgi:hypothetical protein
MKRSTYGLVLASLIPTLIACSSSSSGGGGNNAGAPPPVASKPACIISADCPSGQHCDLEQCIQDCNTTDPCTGELTCTPRARCVTAGTPDDDPAPSKDKAGALTVLPANVALVATQTSFDIDLTSTSSTAVRYRVELSGPHLSVEQERGEFTGKGKVTVKVDASKVKAQDVKGSVKIITSLGDAVVAAPMHLGVTGSYKGFLRFDGGQVSLGQASIALDLLEQHGDVSARVDSSKSLLFPKTGGSESTGHGTYTSSDGFDVTIAQLVDTSVAGARNHFGRPLGHKLRLKMKPNPDGTLTGTFEDQIFGLFAEPTTMTGSVHLAYAAGTVPNVTLGADLDMPASPSKSSVQQDAYIAFGGDADFTTSDNCGYQQTTNCPGGNCTATITSLEASYAKPLQTAMQNKIDTAKPFDSIVTACTASLALNQRADYAKTPSGCGLPSAVACAMQYAVSMPVSNSTTARAASRLVQETMAPAMLVAKNELVLASSDSFAKGLAAEQTHVQTALATLAPVAGWLLQPQNLEFLRTMSPADAQVGTGIGGTAGDTFPAGRALADLFNTLATAEDENTRVSAALSQMTSTTPTSAQEHALVAYMEAATLSEILGQWKTAPPTIAATFNGVLTTHDRGFTAAQQGATVFGVPQGFVPFVYRSEDTGKGATNFEQMMFIAQQSVASEASLEMPFLSNKRTYETSTAALQAQLGQIRSSVDARLKQTCGAGFNPDMVTKESDWAACGANNGGDVGLQKVIVQKAIASLNSANARIAGMAKKIEIDRATLAATIKVREDDLKFIDNQGDISLGLEDDQAALDGMQSAINIGAAAATAEENPAGLYGAMFGAFTTQIKDEMAKRRAQLKIEQEKHATADLEKLDTINGMANIQKEQIDLQQAVLDIDLETLGLLEAQVKIADLVAQAKVAFAERQRQIALVSMDPSLDPSFRILRDSQGQQVLAARTAAQNQLYLAGSALEYELNMSIGDLDGAVLNATNSTTLTALSSCLTNVFNSGRVAYGSPQTYATTVSVRKLLGIKSPRKDEVTGKTLTEGEQFRFFLLKNDNLDGKGGVGLQFATDLQPGNGLWSTDVCNDRLASVQAQLVGDFLGDNQAQVNLSLGGGALLRTCDSSNALNPWSMGTSTSDLDAGFAVIQSGVNTFGDAPPNTSLFGQSVARASWKLVIPGGADAPQNSDVDLTKVDDVVLKFSHQALPRKGSPLAVDLSCLANIGK